jgi:hypothetical protein
LGLELMRRQRFLLPAFGPIPDSSRALRVRNDFGVQWRRREIALFQQLKSLAKKLSYLPALLALIPECAEGN